MSLISLLVTPAVCTTVRSSVLNCDAEFVTASEDVLGFARDTQLSCCNHRRPAHQGPAIGGECRSFGLEIGGQAGDLLLGMSALVANLAAVTVPSVGVRVLVVDSWLPGRA